MDENTIIINCSEWMQNYYRYKDNHLNDSIIVQKARNAEGSGKEAIPAQNCLNQSSQIRRYRGLRLRTFPRLSCTCCSPAGGLRR